MSTTDNFERNDIPESELGRELRALIQTQGITRHMVEGRLNSNTGEAEFCFTSFTVNWTEEELPEE